MKLSLLILLFGVLCGVTGSRYTLRGFKCSDNVLPSLIQVQGELKSLEDICSNLTVSGVDKGEDAGDEKKIELVVEHSSIPLPGSGSVLLQSKTLDTIDLNTKLDNDALIKSFNSACGTSFLVVYLKVEDETTGLDSLILRRNCSDKPGLRLVVKTSTPNPNSNIDRSNMENPLKSLGISSISVENSGEDATAMEKRWIYDAPEVAVFFLPMPYEIAESAFGNISGISEIGNLLNNWNNSNPWLLDSPDMYRNMIKVGLKDLSMFYAPQFLHSSSVLQVKYEENNGMGPQGNNGNGPQGNNGIGPQGNNGNGTQGNNGNGPQGNNGKGPQGNNGKGPQGNNGNRPRGNMPRVEANGVLGSIDLKKLVLPITAQGSGLLIVALDPEKKIPDGNFTDNIFMEFISINYTSEIPNLCSVSPMAQGQKALLRYEPPWEDQQTLVVTTKGNKMKKISEKKRNILKLQEHSALLKASQWGDECKSLSMIMDSTAASIEPVTEKLVSILESVNTTFLDVQVSEEEAEKKIRMSKLINVLTASAKLLLEDKALSKMIVEAGRKLRRQPSRPTIGNMGGYGGYQGNMGSGFQGNMGSGYEGNMGGVEGNMGGFEEYMGEGQQGNNGKGPQGNNGKGPQGNNGKGPQENNNGKGSQGNNGKGPQGNNEKGPQENNNEKGSQGNYGKGSQENNGQGPQGNNGNQPQGNNGRGPQGNNGNQTHGNIGREPQGNNGNRPQGNNGNGPQGNNGNRPQGNMGGGPQGNMGGGPQGNMGGGTQGNNGTGPRGNMGGGPQGNMGNISQGAPRPQGSMGGPDININIPTVQSIEFGGQGINFNPAINNISIDDIPLEALVDPENIEEMSESTIDSFLDQLSSLGSMTDSFDFGSSFNDANMNWSRKKRSAENDDDDVDEDDDDEYEEEEEDEEYKEDDENYKDGKGNKTKKRQSEGKNKKEKNKKMSVQGALQMMMMMAEDKRAPAIVKDISLFLREMIFSPDSESTSRIGSKIPDKLKGEMREVVMMLLKEQMPLEVLSLEAKMISEMGKSFMKIMHSMLPITKDDVKAIFDKTSKVMKNKTNSEEDSEKKKVWELVSKIYETTVNNDKVQSDLEKVLKRVQGAVMMGKPIPMMYGELGSAPSMEDYCTNYATFVQEEVNKGEKPRDMMKTPTVWRRKDESIYKVELCPLTGGWYWSKVALCSCHN